MSASNQSTEQSTSQCPIASGLTSEEALARVPLPVPGSSVHSTVGASVPHTNSVESDDAASSTSSGHSERAQDAVVRQFMEDFLIESERSPESQLDAAAAPPAPAQPHVSPRTTTSSSTDAPTSTSSRSAGRVAPSLPAAMMALDISASLTVRQQSEDDDNDEDDEKASGSVHSPWLAVPMPSSGLAKAPQSVLSPLLRSPDQAHAFGVRTSASGSGRAPVSPPTNASDSPHSAHSVTHSFVPAAALAAALNSPTADPVHGRLAASTELSQVASGAQESVPGHNAPPLSGFQPLQARGGGARGRGTNLMPLLDAPAAPPPPPPPTHGAHGSLSQPQHQSPSFSISSARTTESWEPQAPVPPGRVHAAPSQPSPSPLSQCRGVVPYGEQSCSTGRTSDARTPTPPSWGLAPAAAAAVDTPPSAPPPPLSPPQLYAQADGTLILRTATAMGYSLTPVSTAGGAQVLGNSQLPDPSSASTSSSQTYGTQGWRLSSGPRPDGASSFGLERHSAPNSLLASFDPHASGRGGGGGSGQPFGLGSGFYPEVSFAANNNANANANNNNNNNSSVPFTNTNYMDGSLNRVFTATPVTFPPGHGAPAPNFAMQSLLSAPAQSTYSDPHSQLHTPHTAYGTKPMYTLNSMLLSSSTQSAFGISSEEPSLWSGERGMLSLMSTFEATSTRGQSATPMRSQPRGSISGSARGGGSGGLAGFAVSPNSGASSMAVYASPGMASMPQLYVLPSSVTAAQSHNAASNYTADTAAFQPHRQSQPQSQSQPSQPQTQAPAPVRPLPPLSAAALQSGALSPSPSATSPRTALTVQGTPLLILGDAANPNVPRKTANVHGALAGVLRYISYEDDGLMDAQGNVAALTSPSRGGGSGGASGAEGPTLAPTTVIATQWGAQSGLGQITSPTSSAGGRARFGSGLHSPAVLAAVASAASTIPIRCVPVPALQTAPTVPIFIQMFPCELRDRVRVMNTVMAKVSALVHLPQTLGFTVGVEPRSETSFIAKVRTPAVWRLLYLLRCRVLMDRHGFWYAESMEQYVQLKEYCEDVRRLPQQTRHYQTDGLPCMPLVVEVSRSADRHGGGAGPQTITPPHSAFVPFDQHLPMASVDRHRSKPPPPPPPGLPTPTSPSSVRSGSASPNFGAAPLSPLRPLAVALSASRSAHGAAMASEAGWSVTPTSAAEAMAAAPAGLRQADQRRSSAGVNVAAFAPGLSGTAPGLSSPSGDRTHQIATEMPASSPNSFANHRLSTDVNHAYTEHHSQEDKPDTLTSPFQHLSLVAPGGAEAQESFAYRSLSGVNPAQLGYDTSATHYRVMSGAAGGPAPGLGQGTGTFGVPHYGLRSPLPVRAPPQGHYNQL